MYGLTECIRVSYLPPDQLDARPTSSGIAIPGTDAWIEGADGKPAEAGEVGELMVRGPHVMQGYWRDPERTAERMRPGRWPWEPVLATGDLFRTDEEGYLHWVGRTDDLIKCRGEKVYPREIEEVLHAAEGVQEAAVVGRSGPPPRQRRARSRGPFARARPGRRGASQALRRAAGGPQGAPAGLRARGAAPEREGQGGSPGADRRRHLAGARAGSPG